MKQYKAVYKARKYYNGGVKEYNVTKVIEAKNLRSAENKAKKLQVIGAKARTTYILESIA